MGDGDVEARGRSSGYEAASLSSSLRVGRWQMEDIRSSTPLWAVSTHDIGNAPSSHQVSQVWPHFRAGTFGDNHAMNFSTYLRWNGRSP